jgi:hypothetical protein
LDAPEAWVRRVALNLAAYGDNVRVAWAVQGLTVWAEPTASGDLLRQMSIAERLVDATRSVPY